MENTTMCDTFNHNNELPKIKYKRNTTICNCNYCGKQFETNTKSKKYCSAECSANSQKKRTVCICDYCGKEFERKNSEVIINEKHYCSNQCRYDAMRWNKHDIDIMYEYFDKISDEELLKMLDVKRTRKVMRRKASELGINKLSRTHWTEQEENILRDNYSTKNIADVKLMLPNRTPIQIISKAKTMDLLSYTYLTRRYTEEENEFLKNNYLTMSNAELAEKLNRGEHAISQRLCLLDLYRPREIRKSGYQKLQNYVRARLYGWKRKYRESCGNKCILSGNIRNIEVHHCRSVDLLFQETIEVTGFQLKDNFEDYTDEELHEFYSSFFDLQETYGEYVCIYEGVHTLFHRLYGYGNNTMDQWNEFASNYDNFDDETMRKLCR